MKIPRYAFFDVDGTLRRSDGEISPRVVTAVRRLQESGCLVGLSTGRSLTSAAPIISLLGIQSDSAKVPTILNGPHILFAGSVALYSSGEVLASEAIEPQEVVKIIQACRDLDIGLELYTLKDFWAESDTPLLRIHWGYHPHPPQSVAALENVVAQEKVFKAHIVVDDTRLEAFATLKTLVPTVRFAQASGAANPELIFCSITAAGASPAKMLRAILNRLGGELEEVLAVGDGFSDIPILNAAGISFAMGNSPDEVKRAAKAVTGTVEEDGVAQVIEQFIG